jgi:hypothetical protein
MNPKIKVKKLPGTYQCFEVIDKLACNMIGMTPRPNAVIVHAVMQVEGDRPYAHAYVVLEGIAIDKTFNQMLPFEIYESQFKFLAKKTYTLDEYIEAARKSVDDVIPFDTYIRSFCSDKR